MKTNLMLFLTKLLLATNKYDQPIDTSEGKTSITNITIPIIDTALWAIPIGAGLSAAIIGIKYFFFEDEDERERKPLSKRLKNILIGAIMIYLFPVFLRIFRIS